MYSDSVAHQAHQHRKSARINQSRLQRRFVLPQVNQNSEQGCAERQIQTYIGVRQGGWVAKSTEDQSLSKAILMFNQSLS